MTLYRGSHLQVFDFDGFFEAGAILQKDAQSFLLLWPTSSGSLSNAFADGAQVTVDNFFEKIPFLSFAASWVQVSKNDLMQDLQKELTQPESQVSKDLATTVWQGPNPEGFADSFAKVQLKLAQEGYQKAVPVTQIFSEIEVTPKLRAWWLLQLLKNSSTTQLIYGAWFSEQGVLGATPEALFVRKGNLVETAALAGTKEKSSLAQSGQLLADPKERKEHQLVVADIFSQLSLKAQVEALPTQVLELPTLYHLRTAMTGELFDENTLNEDLVRLLHPTPALGVFPRNQGYHWLEKLDPTITRLCFGAPFTVELSESECYSYVAIRNLMWHKGRLYLTAGCGVVSESQIEKEWQELLAKLNSVKKMFGLI